MTCVEAWWYVWWQNGQRSVQPVQAARSQRVSWKRWQRCFELVFFVPLANLAAMIETQRGRERASTCRTSLIWKAGDDLVVERAKKSTVWAADGGAFVILHFQIRLHTCQPNCCHAERYQRKTRGWKWWKSPPSLLSVHFQKTRRHGSCEPRLALYLLFSIILAYVHELCLRMPPTQSISLSFFMRI